MQLNQESRFVKQIVQILLSFVCAFVIFYTCSKKHVSTIITNKTDTVFVVKTDTIYKTSYIPKFYEVEQYVYDTVTLTDTVFIVQDYKEVRVYQDTIRDTSFIVFLTDTITQNRIVSRSYYGEVLRTEQTITKTSTIQKKRTFCAGISLMYEYENYVIPGVLIGTQKNNIGTHILYNPNFIGFQALWHF